MSKRVAKADEMLRTIQKFKEQTSHSFEEAQHVQNLVQSSILGAQVHATIAIAEQLQVANILKLNELQMRSTFEPDADIKEALGL